MTKNNSPLLISKYSIPSNNSELQTQIVNATRRGDIPEVKRLIDWKCNLSQVDEHGRSILSRILENASFSDKTGLFQATKELIKAGANFDDDVVAAAKKVPFSNQQLKLLQDLNHQTWDNIPLNSIEGNSGNPGEILEVEKVGDSATQCDIL